MSDLESLSVSYYCSASFFLLHAYTWPTVRIVRSASTRPPKRVVRTIQHAHNTTYTTLYSRVYMQPVPILISPCTMTRGTRPVRHIQARTAYGRSTVRRLPGAGVCSGSVVPDYRNTFRNPTDRCRRRIVRRLNYGRALYKYTMTVCRAVVENRRFLSENTVERA